MNGTDTLVDASNSFWLKKHSLPHPCIVCSFIWTYIGLMLSEGIASMGRIFRDEDTMRDTFKVTTYI